jgi:hypothetical protein
VRVAAQASRHGVVPRTAAALAELAERRRSQDDSQPAPPPGAGPPAAVAVLE